MQFLNKVNCQSHSASPANFNPLGLIVLKPGSDRFVCLMLAISSTAACSVRSAETKAPGPITPFHVQEITPSRYAVILINKQIVTVVLISSISLLINFLSYLMRAIGIALRLKAYEIFKEQRISKYFQRICHLNNKIFRKSVPYF